MHWIIVITHFSDIKFEWTVHFNERVIGFKIWVIWCFHKNIFHIITTKIYKYTTASYIMKYLLNYSIFLGKSKIQFNYYNDFTYVAEFIGFVFANISK